MNCIEQRIFRSIFKCLKFARRSSSTRFLEHTKCKRIEILIILALGAPGQGRAWLSRQHQFRILCHRSRGFPGALLLEVDQAELGEQLHVLVHILEIPLYEAR